MALRAPAVLWLPEDGEGDSPLWPADLRPFVATEMIWGCGWREKLSSNRN